MIVLSSFLSSKLFYFSGILLGVFTVTSAIDLYTTYKHLKKKHNEDVLKYRRNNCVVFYRKGTLHGWPPYDKEPINCTVTRNHLLFEPVVYFIDQARASLDIALMILHSSQYVAALRRALGRGVKVRILTNERKSGPGLRELKKTGAKVLEFVCNKIEEDFPNQLMHYKYMIRDYGSENACIYMGSMNLTVGAVVDNYESVVFSEKCVIIDGFHENFQQIWGAVKRENEESIYNKSVLGKLNNDQRMIG